MSTGISRRHVLAGAASLALPFTLPAMGAGGYPVRPIRMIVPLPAGGSADVTVRALGERIQQLTQQSLVVENKPGGIFQIGMQSLAQVPADGYTLIHVNTGMSAAQATQGRFNLLQQLTPVSLTSVTDAILLVPANSKFQSIKDLIAFAQANPGKLNYGSVGDGSYEHLMCANFTRKYGFTATHVPFKGGPDAMTALMRGEIDMFTTVVSLYQRFKDAGRIRSLGLMVNKRSTLVPEVPTLKEQGVDLPPMQYLSGIAAPKGTPAAIVASLNRLIAESLETPELRKKIEASGVSPSVSTPEAYSKMIADEISSLDRIARDIGFSPNKS